MNKRKISIVIPVYNEAERIDQVIKEVFGLEADKEVIVVDDASSDGTGEKLKKLQKEFLFKLIVSEKNEGKGSSLRKGFAKASGFWGVAFDADLEYDVNDIRKLLAEAEKEGEEIIVYGSRFLADYKDKASFHYLGNKFLTALTNILFGLRLTDMETCLKFFPLQVFLNLSLSAKRFEFEPEITAKLAKNKIKIVEVPVGYKRRTYKQGKKLRFKDGIAAVKMILKERLRK